MITNDIRCICDLKIKIAMAKAALKKNKTPFTGKFVFN